MFSDGAWIGWALMFGGVLGTLALISSLGILLEAREKRVKRVTFSSPKGQDWGTVTAIFLDEEAVVAKEIKLDIGLPGPPYVRYAPCGDYTTSRYAQSFSTDGKPGRLVKYTYIVGNYLKGFPEEPQEPIHFSFNCMGGIRKVLPRNDSRTIERGREPGPPSTLSNKKEQRTLRAVTLERFRGRRITATQYDDPPVTGHSLTRWRPEKRIFTALDWKKEEEPLTNKYQDWAAWAKRRAERIARSSLLETYYKPTPVREANRLVREAEEKERHDAKTPRH